MIALRRLNGQELILNSDLIETIEATPDTVVTLVSNKKIIVKNSLEDVVRKTIKYKQLCGQALQVLQKSEEEQKKKE
ncbi:MAG: flagellar FlbD family protein [Chitinispirillaceae bacterium]